MEDLRGKLKHQQHPLPEMKVIGERLTVKSYFFDISTPASCTNDFVTFNTFFNFCSGPSDVSELQPQSLEKYAIRVNIKS
jgi:hypothetical protein